MIIIQSKMIQYTTAQSQQDLRQIIELQAQNLPGSVNEQDMILKDLSNQAK